MNIASAKFWPKSLKKNLDRFMGQNFFYPYFYSFSFLIEKLM